MKKHLPIIGVTIVLCALFLKLLSGYDGRFSVVEKAYNDGLAINLTPGTDSVRLVDVLTRHNYISDKRDAAFAVSRLKHKLAEGTGLGSLYDLNKRVWQVPAAVVDSLGSAGFRKRLRATQEALGIDSAFRAQDVSALKSEKQLSDRHKGSIRVKVVAKDDSASAVRRLFGLDEALCQGVVVRLSVHRLDALKQDTDSLLCYLKTDAKGEAVFNGLDTAMSYSVLPISRGYEFGVPKGTVGGNLAACGDEGVLQCSFTRQEHKVRLFDARTFKRIKEDRSLTVRSPQEFKNTFTVCLGLFFVAWWGLYLLFRRRNKSRSGGILPILMLLTGLCLLTMFSLNDPLTDKLLGVDMARGIITGVVVMALLQGVNFTKLYQGRSLMGFDVPLEFIKWTFKPFRQKVNHLTARLTDKEAGTLSKLLASLLIFCCLPLLLLDLICLTRLSQPLSALLDKLPKGGGYLLMALLLTALLFSPLGASVGGMRVNLNLGILFQPSEIAKYLIIFFMAAYFCVNADKIVKFSDEGNLDLFGSKLRMLVSILVGLGILVGLYLVLGDMGPALVLSFTFILLYSIVKSKIETDSLSEILTCDLAMLVYGVGSFVLCLYVGREFDLMGLFCIAWFVLWIGGVALLKKQVFETPVLFNFILAAFIFGGSLLSGLGPLSSVGERLESRNEMCSNTWGTLPIDGAVADAGENTQVAEGLWGLASGGVMGQGLGNGSPTTIPAFHTDMVLESIGEQMGFVGIVVIVLLIATLLRRTVLLGYRTSHPFAFYLCLGIAIVTAVQFIIIALGSTGMIPLTGVTVPFFSYGKVSMILNLAAFGIILSIARHNTIAKGEEGSVVAQLQKKNIGKYNYSVALLSWIYTGFAALICGVFFYYQFIDRDATLVRPVYVNNVSGIPVVSYNPRIEKITQKLPAGNIYDRNGILLATSDSTLLKKHGKAYSSLGLEYRNLRPARRYYPFGEHLFFMLGDYNTQMLFSANGSRGYMAESEHLDSLRGYDNRLIGSDGRPVKVSLTSEEYNPGRFYGSDYSYRTPYGVQLRDYSALVPYLKAGAYNEETSPVGGGTGSVAADDRVRPNDIHLTLDAVLQTTLQKEMARFIGNKYRDSKFNKLRASIVVLDAEQGDLLASANYPLPDYDRLRAETLIDDKLIYRDNKPQGWKAYTDMDLGLFFATAPGSTAKVMSALAGLRGLGIDAADEGNEDYSYLVYNSQKVGLEPSGTVTMRRAIVKSSNCYFINLVNDHRLYGDLADIYSTVGVSIKGRSPYGLHYADYPPDSDWKSLVTSEEEGAVEAYRKYTEGKLREKMDKHDAWWWTWGQGGLAATPLAMARVAAITAGRKGEMPVTRYLKNQSASSVSLLPAKTVEPLAEFMVEEAVDEKKLKSSAMIGGKTGTAERVLKTAEGKEVKYNPNDAWFICFINDGRGSSKPLAVAVRLERLPHGNMSGHAVAMTQNVVLKVLEDLKYIKK